MSELNETVNVTVDDATVITVPLVTNLTATNAAPTAKTVGDALAAKVDTDSIMEHVTIKVNDEQSDNQGQILIDATGIPISDGSTTSIKDAVDAVNAKTAANIDYASGQTIKAKIDAVASDAASAGSKTAADITYDATASSPVTIKAKVDALQTAVDPLIGAVLTVESIAADANHNVSLDSLIATAADVTAMVAGLFS